MAVELLVQLNRVRGSLVEHVVVLLICLELALEIETQEVEPDENAHGRKEFEEEFDAKLLDFLKKEFFVLKQAGAGGHGWARDLPGG